MPWETQVLMEQDAKLRLHAIGVGPQCLSWQLQKWYDGRTQEYSYVFPDWHSDQYSQAGLLEILYHLTIWVRAVKDSSLRMVC